MAKAKAQSKKTAQQSSKAKKQQADIERYRTYAQYITSGAAVLYGLLWAAAAIMDIDTASLNQFGNFLLVVTMLGGVSMALLYTVKPSTK